jgi:hypothetical protein
MPAAQRQLWHNSTVSIASQSSATRTDSTETGLLTAILCNRSSSEQATKWCPLTQHSTQQGCVSMPAAVQQRSVHSLSIRHHQPDRQHRNRPVQCCVAVLPQQHASSEGPQTFCATDHTQTRRPTGGPYIHQGTQPDSHSKQHQGSCRCPENQMFKAMTVPSLQMLHYQQEGC